MKHNFVVRITLLFLFTSILLNAFTVTAYTSEDGIQTNDVVRLDYVLSYDGQVQQEADDFETKVNDQVLIPGFYKGLLGMKIGEEKTLVIPPEDGYDEGDLVGKTLTFDIYIETILENVNDDGGDDEESGLTKFFRWTGIILTVVAGGFALYLFFGFSKTANTKNCVHCESIGRGKVKSEGVCKSCGTPYCRNSFAKGCMNCKGNTFVPHKKK
ncbi:MAG: FKBP-type peptidyl-prolyl cis-trans isomerase [Candidatus Heimdallarchaeota archaeon]|nr:FKBP-type peptidyl-prolyl cis-trans isomerase [Candidatus Heimdallarchaeota archaeon]